MRMKTLFEGPLYSIRARNGATTTGVTNLSEFSTLGAASTLDVISASTADTAILFIRNS